jgi:hypothetical protein
MKKRKYMNDNNRSIKMLITEISASLIKVCDQWSTLSMIHKQIFDSGTSTVENSKHSAYQNDHVRKYTTLICSLFSI